MGTPSVTRCSASTDPDDIAAALEADGAVIVERLAADDVIDRIDAETRGYREVTGHGRDEFSGRRTRRTGVSCRGTSLTVAVAQHR
jgi:hypothetical protein